MSVWVMLGFLSKFYGYGEEKNQLTYDRFKQIAGLVKESTKDTKMVMQTLLGKL